MRLVTSRPNSEPLPAPVHDALAGVTPDALRELVERVAIHRPRGSTGHAAVRRVVTELLAQGVGVADVRLDEAGNVLAGDPATARLLVGAHYDGAAGTPGADDNASGVAAVLAAARAVGPRAGVAYVLFDGEENRFIGSRSLAVRLDGDRPPEVHVLDTVGYASRAAGSQRNPVPGVPAPDVGDFLGLVANHCGGAALDRVLAAAAAHPVPVQGLYLPDVPAEGIGRVSPHLMRSDHAPFWRAARPAVFWTDTAEFRNPHYHRPTDTPDTLDYDFLTGVARLLAHVILRG
jgi:Zn-dependent M28 family amino/carboxypeptidase